MYVYFIKHCINSSGNGESLFDKGPRGTVGRARLRILKHLWPSLMFCDPSDASRTLEQSNLAPLMKRLLMSAPLIR